MSQQGSGASRVVMGFATNQSEESLRIFCQSLRAVYSPDECDLVILTNRAESYFGDLTVLGVRFESTTSNWSPSTTRGSKAINRLVLHGMRLFERMAAPPRFGEIHDAYRVLLETWHHPQLARWFAYERVLKLASQFDAVFLADVKDVVFQAPFFPATSFDGVVLYEDANPYGQCQWNDMWYREAYGNSAHQKVVGKMPVCIGTLMASRDALLRALSQFTAAMARDPFGRIEQAIFNHLLHAVGLAAPCVVRPNMTDVVATLASEKAFGEVRVVDGAIRRVADGSKVPVVHMYDRFPSTLAFCRQAYLRPTAEHRAPLVAGVVQAAGAAG